MGKKIAIKNKAQQKDVTGITWFNKGTVSKARNNSKSNWQLQQQLKTQLNSL
ncbi:hypothetical protein [Lutibacter agarilyticus]|uniref:hypothetical protein n=1 Tax=Lutibacter agarilyticus TaxID=1109740 RepID=UPI0015954D94|nr:hypothetical protein [Lutibacter agarilyticus]